MAKNRVFPSLSQGTPNLDAFASFSGFSTQSPFSGLDVGSLVETAKQEGFFAGFDAGYDQGVKSIINKLDKYITDLLDQHILLNTRITDFVKKEIESKFQTEGFVLKEARASFNDFSSKNIKILFIIETEIENELWFASLLSNLEKKIFEENNSIAELMYINQRDKELDRGLVESNYPSKREFQP